MKKTHRIDNRLRFRKMIGRRLLLLAKVLVIISIGWTFIAYERVRNQNNSSSSTVEDDMMETTVNFATYPPPLDRYQVEYLYDVFVTSLVPHIMEEQYVVVPTEAFVTDTLPETDDDEDYFYYKEYVPDLNFEGPGEMGLPVFLTNLTEKQIYLVEQGWKLNEYNQYVSDMISVRRKLPDYRHEQCHVKYPIRRLPKASIIICFHNEARSVLLRTLHSIIDRSPDILIQEIILIDDFSTSPHFNYTLENYVSQFPKVKLIRSEKREGLIRSRLLGTSVAKGPVLIFLDSHCECTEGWLEPLLHRIYQNKTNVVSPVIDEIKDDTFEYRSRDQNKITIGGFSWDLTFHFLTYSKNPRSGGNIWDPVETPVIAGGLFAIDKEFFLHLGAFDSGFHIWGGENFEISFKTWMCGGRLEVIPCSHVGHVFRLSKPYSWEGEKEEVKKSNFIRLAKVWMDDYAKYFLKFHGNDEIEHGNLTSRIQLREKLNCESFKWYMNNVYPDLVDPSNAVAMGEIRNLQSNGSEYSCLDAGKKPIGTAYCKQKNLNQFWTLTISGEIRGHYMCLEYHKELKLRTCGKDVEKQRWSYDPANNLIRNDKSELCLHMRSDMRTVAMRTCSSNILRQKWLFQNYGAFELDGSS